MARLLSQGSFLETDVASATTCNIAASTVLTLKVNITGTTTITSFGTAAKKLRFIRFAAALTLTHNGTSLILPGGANITTAAGDTCTAMSDTSGNWRVYNYQRASGRALVDPAKPYFRVTLAADQTGVADATATKIAFDTEAADVGGYYDNATNFRWTPPAGLVTMQLQLVLSGTYLASGLIRALIYKNGSSFAFSTSRTGTTTGGGTFIAVTDIANGTDYYEAWGYGDTSASTATFVAVGSFFSGACFAT